MHPNRSRYYRIYLLHQIDTRLKKNKNDIFKRVNFQNEAL